MRSLYDKPPALRLCECRSTVVDDETCILCGRYVAVPARDEPAVKAPPRRWTRASVVRAIHAFVFFHDRLPGEAEWGAGNRSTWPPANVVRRLFGSFEEGLAAAGVI